ncbi:MAG: BatA domain-containing protein [Gemmatimonadales bacterium]
MLSLLSPLWLAGLVALAVPLALHLWNRRPTMVVKIGSLRDLAGPPGPRALGRHLEDIPLLLLRLAVLTAVVLGLAGLAVRRAATGTGGVSVLLVDPLLLDDSLAVFSDPVVDSLRRAGVPIHLLAKGFPEIGVSVLDGFRGGDWALLGQLDDSLPPGSHVTVVAAMTAGQFGPGRPSLRSRYDFRPIRSMTPNRLADRPVDTTTVEVIVGQGYEADAELVSAAWSAAIEAYTGVPPRLVESIPDGSKGQPSADIFIWLADQSVSQPILDRCTSGATLIEFLAGEPHEVQDPEIASGPTSGAPTALFSEVVWLRSGAPEGTPILTDGSGQPLLTVSPLGAGQHYRVATRLGGDWSTLGLGADLPELALLILRGPRTGVETAPVYPGQAGIRLRATDHAATGGWQRLTSWAVLLAALLLTAERMVVHARWQAEAA